MFLFSLTFFPNKIMIIPNTSNSEQSHIFVWKTNAVEYAVKNVSLRICFFVQLNNKFHKYSCCMDQQWVLKKSYLSSLKLEILLFFLFFFKVKKNLTFLSIFVFILEKKGFFLRLSLN